MSEAADMRKQLVAMESQVAQLFGRVNLGDWSNDQEVPWWLAPVIFPQATRAIEARALARAEVVNAVQLTAAVKADGQSNRGSAAVVADILDDWCGTRVPGRPPRPHWSAMLGEVIAYGESFRAGSAMRAASIELSQRLLERGFASAQ
jgi:hypothetical protein